MMEFAERNQLRILNLTDKCVGRNTREEAVLDNVLCDDRAYKNIKLYALTRSKRNAVSLIIIWST